MEAIVENKPTKVVPKGIVCDEDKQEKEFSEFLKLWIENKIEYESLLESMPDLYKSKWKMVLRKLIRSKF